ncbi:hypothetical protein BU23DRAFT_282157 [Bimuria novae-zelandiae CBS 107.79]|uniref:Zn(2)-C6 fungal-type domain-containing protein n=1 Tax=Bimuria novae-zelandiae CBS 107.79 TaxID=1447943 RepID=A0A6A5USC4_9PLEO|nr:hypothetical protein BU23DRAFT_282157 [Bimuria novae-zelandiae CBS 107.79]
MTTQPRRKACVECRQQKIRCDVEQHKTPHEACSRCKKMNLECRILPTSTRNLRQTKAEMRRELEELRWNMRQGHGDPNSTPGSLGDASSFRSPHEHPTGSFSNPSAPGTDASMSPAMEHGPSAVAGKEVKGSASGPTITRALDGFVVDARKIDDCFALFFTQYHPLLPILESSLAPSSANGYYELSPFLFWCIVVTGARHYLEDRSILDKVSELITPLAFSSMALRSTPIPVIQGLLILCTWRLPTNSMYKDMTHVLCGAAIHLATSIGLHVAGAGQDFARTPLKTDQEQVVFRAKLWMQCIIVSIRTSCAEGIPPLVIAESFYDGNEKDREDLAALFPPDLQYSRKIHIMLHKAMAAMARSDIKHVNCDSKVLRSLVSIYDSELLRLAAVSPSELDSFQMSCARIHVLAFHFFAHPLNPGHDVEALSRLYSLCISTLQTAHAMTQQANFAFISQSFIDRTICLAGFVILKLSRSPFQQHLDLPAGEQAYYNAAQFSKATSLQTGDLGDRICQILTNLWQSNKVFRRRDGTIESLGIRLRTRLSMSVSFDMFWYWREEFGHMYNPYNGEEGLPANAQTQPTTPAPGITQAITATAPPQPIKMDPNNLSLQPLGGQPAPIGFDRGWNGEAYMFPPMLDQFPDYDWAASFDFSNDPSQMQIPQIPPPVNMGPMNAGPAGFQYG